MIKKWFSNIGPGTLVAAAFIGPGTVTLCTMAGVKFGYNLLWAMLLSVFFTVILQEMAARVGVVSQKGLSEVIRTQIKTPFLNKAIIILILLAIVVGNAAYEAGNISGGVLGLETVTGKIELLDVNLLPIVIGLVAFGLLYIGSYKLVERILVTLVIIMSISFIATAIITKPNLSELFKGSFVPSFPEGSLLTIVGLIGTTVVPYNLFLHASLVKEKWNSPSKLKLAQKDTVFSIIMGGFVSIAIIISAAGSQLVEVSSVSDLASGLEPLYGAFAKWFLSIGLFAAGITSAITAPLATAYVVKGCLGFEGGLKSKSFRSIWIIILVLGVVFSSLQIKPIQIIQFAQVANGILLPIIAGVLLWVVNKRDVLGRFVNTKLQNFIGLIILVVTIFLGLKGILKVFSII